MKFQTSLSYGEAHILPLLLSADTGLKNLFNKRLLTFICGSTPDS
jgi:hypothetical protein